MEPMLGPRQPFFRLVRPRAWTAPEELCGSRDYTMVAGMISHHRTRRPHAEYRITRDGATIETIPATPHCAGCDRSDQTGYCKGSATTHTAALIATTQDEYEAVEADIFPDPVSGICPRCNGTQRAPKRIGDGRFAWGDCERCQTRDADDSPTEKARRTDAAAAIRAVIDGLIDEVEISTHGSYNHQEAGVRLLDEIQALTKIADELAA